MILSVDVRLACGNGKHATSSALALRKTTSYLLRRCHTKTELRQVMSAKLSAVAGDAHTVTEPLHLMCAEPGERALLVNLQKVVRHALHVCA